MVEKIEESVHLNGFVDILMSRRIGMKQHSRVKLSFCLEDQILKTNTNNNFKLKILDMLRRFDQIAQNVSWEPDWSTTWRQDNPCQCAPATYAGF